MMAYLQYLLVIGFSFFINLLPESWALWFGRQLGRMAFHLDREHQKVALQNLYTAFGQEKPPEELRAIAKRTFQNLGMTVVEFFRIPKLDTETFKKRVEVEGVEFFNQVLNNENKSGALLLVSHFGNWELMGLVPRAYGYSFSVIAKPMKNKRVDRLVNGIREKAGLEVISTVGASRKVLRALSQNRFVGILIDQRAKRSEGVWADFFGKKAPTTPSLAVLAMRTGAPILPIFMIRDGYQKHRLLIKEPLRLTETGDVKKDVEANTEKINQTLEEMIRQYPDQWFWVHRRWERRKRAHRR